MIKVGDLSNDELLARLRIHVDRGNIWLVGLLAYLGELDARRLYAEQACTSTWDFCVRRLGMSEGEAHRRIAAARVLRKFPLARTYLEGGRIHLCAIYELYKYITEDNHEELLREAAGKTTKEVSAMIAARFPKPDIHPCIEVLAPQPTLPIATAGSGLPNGGCSASRTAPSEVRPRVAPLSATRYRVELTISHETKDKLERVRDLMRHRNPNGDLEKIFDLSLDLLLTKLEKERLGKTSRPKAKTVAVSSQVTGTKSVQRRDATPSHRDDTTGSDRGDAANAHRDDATGSDQRDATNAHRDDATCSDRGDAANADRDDANCSDRGDAANAHRDDATYSDRGDAANAHRDDATCSDRGDAANAHRDDATCSDRGDATNADRDDANYSQPDNKRAARRSNVPRAVRREVFARDGEQCTFVDAEGNRCPARGFVELDHIKAKALGGGDEVENLRLRCRVHNHHHAEQVFGREYVEKRIHLRRRKSDVVSAPVFESAARGLRSLGFREPEVRDVIARLATSHDAGASV